MIYREAGNFGITHFVFFPCENGGLLVLTRGGSQGVIKISGLFMINF